MFKGKGKARKSLAGALALALVITGMNLSGFGMIKAEAAEELVIYGNGVLGTVLQPRAMGNYTFTNKKGEVLAENTLRYEITENDIGDTITITDDLGNSAVIETPESFPITSTFSKIAITGAINGGVYQEGREIGIKRTNHPDLYTNFWTVPTGTYKFYFGDTPDGSFKEFAEMTLPDGKVKLPTKAVGKYIKVEFIPENPYFTGTLSAVSDVTVTGDITYIFKNVSTSTYEYQDSTDVGRSLSNDAERLYYVSEEVPSKKNISEIASFEWKIFSDGTYTTLGTGSSFQFNDAVMEQINGMSIGQKTFCLYITGKGPYAGQTTNMIFGYVYVTDTSGENPLKGITVSVLGKDPISGNNVLYSAYGFPGERLGVVTNPERMFITEDGMKWSINDGETIASGSEFVIPSDIAPGSRIRGTYTNAWGSVTDDIMVKVPVESIIIPGTEYKVNDIINPIFTPTMSQDIYTYAWYTSGEGTSIGSDLCYVPDTSMVGKQVYVKATPERSDSFAKTITSNSVTIVEEGLPSLTGVTITGDFKQGGTVMAQATPVGANATYQWQSTDAKYDIFANDSSVTIPSDLVGEIYVVAIGMGDYTGTVESARYKVEVGEAPEDPKEIKDVMIFEDIIAGGWVYVRSDPFNATFDAVWTLDGIEVSTSFDYTIPADAAGKKLEVTITGKDGWTGSAVSKVEVGEAPEDPDGGKIPDSTEDVTEQDKPITDMESTAHGDVLVRVSQGQSYVITIPAAITLDGSTHESQTGFNVTVTANISGKDNIKVVPGSDTITYKERNGVKKDLSGTVYVPNTEYNVGRCGQTALEEGYVEDDCYVSIEKLSAGFWTGTMEWNISIDAL